MRTDGGGPLSLSQFLRRRWQTGMLLVTSACFGDRPAPANDAEPVDSSQTDTSLIPEEEEPRPRVRRVTDKTLGGRQFWADAQFFHGWRIQQNVLTDHYRLLDEDDYRHASGTLDECRTKLTEIQTERKLPAMSGEAVVLVHGLVRSHKSMNKLHRHLALEQAGYQAFSFGYPSTQIGIDDAAGYLHQVMQSLQGFERIHFVAHSMGGLVVRSCLAQHPDPRVGRVVMIATPNLGADLADRFHRLRLFQTLFGSAGQQLIGAPEGFIAGLPTPGFEFGVIAGGRGNDRGYNPLITGDDDGTVSVASTRLPGAADFVVVDRLHTFLIVDQTTREYTLRFLKEGRFRAETEAEPILALEPLDKPRANGEDRR